MDNQVKPLRLSDAIALGRMTVDVWEATNLDGCALGMAANAVGIDRKYENLKRVWPWLRNPLDKCPAGCFMCSFKSSSLAVGHIFDTHICGGLEPKWTLDQLIDWIRSVEPPEPPAEPEGEVPCSIGTNVLAAKSH